MEADVLNRIEEDLKFIKKEVSEIKERVADPDTILSKDDQKAIDDYKNEMREGTLTSFDKFEKELGIED